MLIRCQQCRATFSLQDGVALGAGSFKVECGRCRHVFEAAAPEKPRQPPSTPAPPVTDPDSVERRATADELAFALDPRPPEPRSGPALLKPALLKPALWVAAAVVLALAAFTFTRAHLSGLTRAEKTRMREARGKLLRDDLQSLQEAAALFTKAARLSPDDAEPEGELGFALLLLGGTHLALADHGELRFLQEGLSAAKVALEEDAEDAAALRALALHAALSGAKDQGGEPLDHAARRAPSDPWIAYTRAALLLAGPPSREGQDEALAALAVARKAEPRILRAQVEVAAISAARGEAGPARLELTQVLKQNPKHERAQRLLASLPPVP